MTITRVKTKYGIVVGVPGNGNTIFKGIPYAKAPVGPLRFSAPQELDCWEGERICDHWPKAALQFNDPRRRPLPLGHPRRTLELQLKEDYFMDTLETDEDCLYLNVWTPAESPDEKLPVMCWIHGGGFNTGYSFEPMYDGELMNRRGVILVTIGYRLGAMGFLAHPELYGKAPRGACNFGIQDQIMALKWIRENIAAFGGDPDRVTVHGYSAGGISSKLLLVSPLSKGLLRRAIIQSGGGLNAADPTRTKEELGEITKQALELLGWTLEDIMTRDAKEVNFSLCDAAAEVLEGKEMYIYQPCVDGCVFTELPEKTIYDGNYHDDVEIICGTVTGDSWMFTRKVRSQLTDNPDVLHAFAYSPQIAWGTHQMRTGRKPIRAYFFERIIPGPEGTVPHGSEIPYMFGTLSRFDRPWTEYDYKLMNAVNGYWTNFAKTGDPNGDGLPEWPFFTAETPFAMHFTDNDFRAEDIVGNAEAERVINFTISHPGMLELLEGF
jgi:para-nitrobenzyl esterase